jgi:hypothetical protein
MSDSNDSVPNRLKGVTRNGAYYALNDMTAEVVPLSVAKRLHAALTTTLKCLEMDESGKAYAEEIARKTLDEIHSHNVERMDK